MKIKITYEVYEPVTKVAEIELDDKYSCYVNKTIAELTADDYDLCDEAIATIKKTLTKLDPYFNDEYWEVTEW